MAQLSLTTALDLVGDVRELSAEDLAEYKRLGPAEPMTLDSVKLRHHRIANLLAQGLKVTEVAYIVGVNPQAIHVMKRNAAFQELLKEIQSEIFEDDKLIGSQMREITIHGLHKLQQEIIDGAISGDDLRKVVEGTLDRIGHGPTRKVEKRSVVLNATQIQLIREEVRSAEAQGHGAALRAGGDTSGDATSGTLREAEAWTPVREEASRGASALAADGEDREGVD